MTETFFTNTLPAPTAQLVAQLQTQPSIFLAQFYLSGGTGLSLQIGHRESEDLDFFNFNHFSPAAIEQELTHLGSLSETELAEGTLNTFVNQVKLQFLEYPYPLLEPFVDFNGIKLSSIKDIACTKLQTIGMRGSKKDFIDLYFLFEIYSLPTLLNAVTQKYKNSDYSQSHIIKSLVYFEDADQQPLPRMHKPIEWEVVKQKMRQEVRKIGF